MIGDTLVRRVASAHEQDWLDGKIGPIQGYVLPTSSG